MDKTIDENHIQIAKQVSDYATGIHLAASPLINHHFIEEKYVDRILENIKMNGPYIVVADYVALPHAQPSKLVLKTGLSLLLLEEPVDLLGNPIHVFIVLAAKDNHEHLGLLQSLAIFLMEKENITALIECKTKPDILDVLEKRWVTS